MGKILNIAIYPDYDEVFDDGIQNKDLLFFIKDIPTIDLVSLISFISACLDSKIENFKAQNFILNDLLIRLSRNEQLTISQRINAVSDKAPIIVFHPVACLMLLQVSILNFKSGKTKHIRKDDARNILKAFLFANTKYSSEMMDLVPSLTDLRDLEKTLGLAIGMDVAQSRFFNAHKDILEQSYKLREFYNFLQTDDEIGGKYYEAFIKSKNFSSFDQIIKVMWAIYFKIASFNEDFDFKNIKSVINISDEEANVKNYFNTISILESEWDTYRHNFIDSDSDFKLIRERPLYKLNQNHFAVLNGNFFADKVFNSLFFDYFNFISNEGYPKNFGDFKSYYSEIFVEKYLLDKILKNIFKKNKLDVEEHGDFLKVKGKHNKDYSDYYVRKGNKLILFECKDTIMRSEIKYSYDYEDIKKDIDKKFVDGAGANQLLKVIDSVSNLQIPFDKMEKIDMKTLIIFPVIIYTDYTYKARGINYYVNTTFSDTIVMKKFEFKVERIIMIHIDTLINFQDLFRDKVNFFNTLERYNKYVIANEKNTVNLDKSDLLSFNSYDTFLQEYLFKERRFTNNEIKFYYKLYKEIYN